MIMHDYNGEKEWNVLVSVDYPHYAALVNTIK